MKTIYGRDLKVGDLLNTWYNDFVRVERIGEYRTQVLHGQKFELATAFCTNNYHITVFLECRDVRVAA